MRNICALILVHKNIEQVCRLCKCLSNKNIYIVIHLDKKMVVKADDFRNIQNSAANVYICPNRTSCIIDDWSLVETTLNLVKFAKQNLPEIAYYVLMSGQDYPIKPIDTFVDFLNINYPKPYIDCTPYNINNWIFQKFNHTKLMKYAKKLKNLYKLRGPVLIVSILEKIIARCCFTDYKIQKFNIPLYGGSAWWILPNIIIDDILQLSNENMEFIKCFKDSITPEETFFQTLSMCSSLSDLILVNPNNQIMQNCLTYSLFFGINKDFMGHPHIITRDDFSLLKERREFFARKFDAKVDSEILDLIDSDISKL